MISHNEMNERESRLSLAKPRQGWNSFLGSESLIEYTEDLHAWAMIDYYKVSGVSVAGR